MLKLTYTELAFIVSALRTAEVQYRRGGNDAHLPRLAEQLHRQANEANALADKIEAGY